MFIEELEVVAPAADPNAVYGFSLFAVVILAAVFC